MRGISRHFSIAVPAEIVDESCHESNFTSTTTPKSASRERVERIVQRDLVMGSFELSPDQIFYLLEPNHLP